MSGRGIPGTRSGWFALGIVILAIYMATPAEAYRRPGTTERVSVTSEGAQTSPAPLDDGNPTGCGGLEKLSDITNDGRFIAFVSRSPDLVPRDTNLACDIFVRDRVRGITQLVTLGFRGTPALGDSYSPSISSNGRYVAFSSAAPNLVQGDTNTAQDVFVHDRRSGLTRRVSVASDGAQTSQPLLNHDSSSPSISLNGRYVAFASSATDLVDRAESGGIFLHDLKTRKTELVSLASDGSYRSANALYPSVSSSGRFVSFWSDAEDLVPDQECTVFSVFVRDRTKRRTELVSVASDGTQAGCEGIGLYGFAFQQGARAISGNGRYVVFTHADPLLVPSDTNRSSTPVFDGQDVFVHDRTTGLTERISVSSVGEEGTRDGFAPSISPDGRFVMFLTLSANLVEGDTASTDTTRLTSDADVMVHDRATGALEWISVSPDGEQAKNCPYGGSDGISYTGGIGSGGRYLSYTSCADNLVSGDSNSAWDVFVRDRGPVVGAGSRLTAAGEPRFQRSGLYEIVDPAHDVDPGGAGRGAELIGASVAYRAAHSDLFIAIDVDRLPGPRGGVAGFSAAGDPAIVYGLRFTANGIPYELRASKIPGVDFTKPRFGLFECSMLVCSEVTQLAGGYGTTGESIVMSVPLSAIRIAGGGKLIDVTAFSGYGNYELGVTNLLDEAAKS